MLLKASVTFDLNNNVTVPAKSAIEPKSKLRPNSSKPKIDL